MMRFATMSRLLVLVVVAMVAAGCAFGTTRVEVGSDPLEPIAAQRSGRLLVRRFTDERENKEIIGNKRNGFGMAVGSIGIPEGQKLEDVLTTHFAEAIRHAGYEVTVDPSGSVSASGYDAVVEGSIRKFWMDLYMAVWHEVDVDLRVLPAHGGAPAWSGTMHGKETNTLWLGTSGEYAKVIRQSLTRALNQTAAEFADGEASSAIGRCRGGSQ